MILRLWLRLWKVSRRHAATRLCDEYSTEVNVAVHEFADVYGSGMGRTRVLNADTKLSADYALHDAYYDFFERPAEPTENRLHP